MGRDPEVTSRIMSRIHSKNTRPELNLYQELERIGLKFKKQFKVEGKPDFAFPNEKVAIFCDGDFWHGNNWKIRGYSKFEDDIKSNQGYWIEKINNNMKRDRKVNGILCQKGWTVLRFWESDIKKDVNNCALKVKKVVASRRK